MKKIKDWEEKLSDKMMDSGCEGYHEFTIDYVEKLLEKKIKKAIKFQTKDIRKKIEGMNGLAVDGGEQSIDFYTGYGKAIFDILNKL